MRRIPAVFMAAFVLIVVFAAGAWQSQQNFGGLPSGIAFSSPTLTISSAGNGNGAIALSGTTSGIASWTAPAVAGTLTNPMVSTNSLQIPTGAVYNINNDTGLSRGAADFWVAGNGTAGNASAVFAADGNVVALTADWTCGTAGTVADCSTAQIVGSGGGVPLTFTLPLVARSWTWQCDGVVGQATAATANSWNFLTATNGATNVTANYSMNTAATAMTGGAVTDQASTTTTVVIAPTWTLGGTATKMPFHIWGRVETASAAGTVLSLQLVAPTVADLVTIYRGSSCRIY
jgi:hypothetical protein